MAKLETSVYGDFDEILKRIEDGILNEKPNPPAMLG